MVSIAFDYSFPDEMNVNLGSDQIKFFHVPSVEIDSKIYDWVIAQIAKFKRMKLIEKRNISDLIR